MANYVTDDGICLRVTDFSETSQVVGVFTRGHGVVPMIAKGAKRATKKNSMSGPLDLLTSGEVIFVPAKGAAELSVLAGWELRNHRGELRKNLAGLNGAMICAEVTALLVQPHDPHAELFEELEAALGLMAGVRTADARGGGVCKGGGSRRRGMGRRWRHVWFAERSCAAGGGEGMVRFSPRAGGVVCAECPIEAGMGVVISVAGRMVAALGRLPGPVELAKSPPERSADAGALQAAMGILLAQVEAVTDREVRTRHLVGSVFG